MRRDGVRDEDVTPEGAPRRMLPHMGPVPNALATLAAQISTVALAVALDACGFPEAATVVVFVLGVIVTAILTDGWAYSVAASALGVLAFNYFLVEPRLSLRAWGPDYPETFAVMFAVAIVSSYLVARMRESERASKEAALVAQHEQLRADMLRSVSHDLRTPLTAISGSADILLADEGTLDASTRARLAREMRDDATWLADVVENLLVVTRLDDGAFELETCLEAVDEVIEEALRHVRRDLAGHEVTVAPTAELLFARMDAQLVVQVIVNLVNNALAHTPRGCSVTIGASRMGDKVAITVSDDGEGVAEGDRQRIFERFYTAADGASDSRRGIGLGLALCKAIVEAHGGTIWVTDAEPHGAAFTFTLPLEEVARDA